jgi:C4-dicarboxylate-specific signal transduction histidine kinase
MSQEMLKQESQQQGRLIELNQKAINTTDRMARIVKGLMEFANESERSSIQAVSIQSCVDRAMDFCREKLVSHGIGLIVDEIDQDLKTVVRPSDLIQVLVSLIMNSVEAIQDDQVRWIKIEVVSNQSHALIRISDSGLGIDPKIAAKMFVPFFSTKDNGSGNGMGLSVAKTIINGSNGDLQYLPDEKNTTFEISLTRSFD